MESVLLAFDPVVVHHRGFVLPLSPVQARDNWLSGRDFQDRLDRFTSLRYWYRIASDSYLRR